MSEVNIDIAKIAESEVAKKTANWIYKVIGEPLEDGVGLLFADALKERRLQNSIRLREETLKFTVLNQKQIPLSLGYKLLEKATLEENESLISKWAKLLTNAMDQDFEGEVRKIYIDILDSIEPIDAQVLDDLYKEPDPINPLFIYQPGLSETILISIDTLKSLNLITEHFEEKQVEAIGDGGTFSGSTNIKGNFAGEYILTNLGKSFINAVNRLDGK